MGLTRATDSYISTSRQVRGAELSRSVTFGKSTMCRKQQQDEEPRDSHNNAARPGLEGCERKEMRNLAKTENEIMRRP